MRGMCSPMSHAAGLIGMYITLVTPAVGAGGHWRIMDQSMLFALQPLTTDGIVTAAISMLALLIAVWAAIAGQLREFRQEVAADRRATNTRLDAAHSRIDTVSAP